MSTLGESESDRRAPLRAVVVGSGIGGSAATLLLAHAGIPTTLVEKNRRLGGSCSGYEKQGFHVDIGTHMFSRGPRGPLGDVLRRAGEDGAIDFRRTRDIAELRFPARTKSAPREGLRLSPPPPGPDGVVRIAVPAEVRRLLPFVARLGRALELSAQEAASAARLFTHILAMSDEEAASWDKTTLEEFILPYCDHPGTIGTFGFLLGLYFVLPYWEVSAGEALLAFRRMAHDNFLSYPRGGASAIPETYCRLARERGAEVRTGTGVRRIVVTSHEGDTRVRGVELEDGTLLPASIVVSTSSVRTTVLRLVGREHFPEAYAARAERLRGSMIAVQAKIGLKKKLVDAGALVGGVGDDVDLLSVSTGDMKGMFRALEEGRVPPIVPFYCPVPTNFDPDLAPPGHQLLTVCAVAPTSDVELADPPSSWEDAMVKTLARVVPGLEENALFVDRFSVAFIERWIGKEFGPAISTGQTPDQVGRERPSVHTPIRGLYMAGCGAGGRGVGTELAADSAMDAVDRILADLGRPLPPRASVSGRAARWSSAPLAWLTRVS